MSTSSIRELSIFGGRPAFEEPLHVGRPNLGDRAALLARIEGALDRRWLTNNGVLVREFERRVERLLGVKHCVAMCNATLGIEIAARALALAGEVIVPAFTFVATAHALDWAGLTPVFCDIDPATHNIDPAAAERLINERTSAIVGVHVWGRPCDVPALSRLAAAYNLDLLFDAAHAFGCDLDGVKIGNFGRCEIFSFHATKFVNAFEGGALVTNDEGIAKRARLMSNFGFAGVDTVVCSGTNAKMSEVSAAMALTALDALEDIVARNRTLHARYAAHLDSVDGLSVIRYDSHNTSNFQYVIVEVDDARAGLTRDEVKDVLWAENVFARRYFYPGCHRMEPYASRQPGVSLPQTDALSSRVLSLPTGTAVSVGDVDRVCQIITAAVQHNREVRARLQSRQSANLVV